jgi:hypothetical protein
VTEEFRSSPEATIEDRLRIDLFPPYRRRWIGEFSVRMLWASLFVLLDFGFEDLLYEIRRALSRAPINICKKVALS